MFRFVAILIKTTIVIEQEMTLQCWYFEMFVSTKLTIYVCSC